MLFLKEGAETQVRPIPLGEGRKKISFNGITITDGIDRLEQRGENNAICRIWQTRRKFAEAVTRCNRKGEPRVRPSRGKAPTKQWGLFV